MKADDGMKGAIWQKLMCSPRERWIGDTCWKTHKKYPWLANLLTVNTQLISQMKKQGEKKKKKREKPQIPPELIKSYIADKIRISDSWKDEIEKILLWPKKVKEVMIKRKEKSRWKKDIYEISNEISKDYN